MFSLTQFMGSMEKGVCTWLRNLKRIVAVPSQYGLKSQIRRLQLPIR